jgi:hypothetical protein
MLHKTFNNTFINETASGHLLTKAWYSDFSDIRLSVQKYWYLGTATVILHSLYQFSYVTLYRATPLWVPQISHFRRQIKLACLCVLSSDNLLSFIKTFQRQMCVSYSLKRLC